MSRLIPLIVHADDFGETVEITRGICEAIEGGAVTSTTIMANMPGTDDALPRVAALADRASFGVHLNLCEGRPLTQGATLVDEHGQFHRKRELFVRAATRRLSLGDVEAEVVAQIGLVHDAGVRISHVDGHKHLHQLPVVREAVARVLPRFGIERVRITRLAGWPGFSGPATWVREYLARPAAKCFARAGLRSPRRVLDLQRLMIRGDEFARAQLRRAPHGAIELFCHPGTARSDAEKPGSCSRHAELEYLLSGQFRDLLRTAVAQPITFWDV